MTNPLFNNGDKIKVAKFTSYNPVDGDRYCIVYTTDGDVDHVLLDSVHVIRASKKLPIYYNQNAREWMYPILCHVQNSRHRKKVYIEERLIESV